MTRILTRPRNDVAFFPKFMGSFFEDANQDVAASQTSHHSYVPRVDISEDASNIYVLAELPGLAKEDVKLTVREGTLILRGEKKHKDKKEDRNYYRIERRYGEFVRQFSLPENVKEEAVRANFTNGILEITIPKSEPQKPKEHEVPINVNLN